MAHYFIYQDRLGAPFHTIRELKMVIPGGRERRQRSFHPKVMLILGGGGCTLRMVDGFSVDIEPGGLLVVAKPCYHFYSVKGGEDQEVTVFGMFMEEAVTRRTRRQPREEEMRQLLKELFSETRYIPNGVTPAMTSLVHQFREEVASRKPGTLVRQHLLAVDLLLTLARHLQSAASPELPPLRARSQAFIANEIREYLGKTIHRKHTLAQIAWHLQLSEEHLARVFKKETGMTVMGFLQSIRVDAAKAMLVQTNHPIAALAEMVGFNSSNHFCRAFYRITGETPSAYRRTATPCAAR